MSTVKLPEWFKVGAKAYLYGCTPAYEVVEIREDLWLSEDAFGDKGILPLNEVPSCWSPIANEDNEPRKNAPTEN